MVRTTRQVGDDVVQVRIDRRMVRVVRLVDRGQSGAQWRIGGPLVARA